MTREGTAPEPPEEPGPVIAGRKVTAAGTLRRVMLFARALGFVFLVFFLPEVAAGLAGMALPGSGFTGLLAGTSDAPLLSLLVTAAGVAIALLFVGLHGKLGYGADRPRGLVRFDRAWGTDWGRGLLWGAGAATVAIAPLVATGAVRIRGLAAREHGIGFTLALLLAIVLKSAHEEMGFRGPAFRDLGRAMGAPLAAAFLAGSFALVHGGNPAFGRVALLAVFAAGFALAGFVRARGDLGLAIGAHTGWNVASGLVWSLPVSGYRLPGRLLEVDFSAAPAAVRWSGGDFGIEGGLAGVLALFALGFLAWRQRSGPGPGRWDAIGDSAGEDRTDSAAAS